MMRVDWGKVCLITRLEKQVENQFFVVWSHLITKGLRPGDSFIIVKDRPAHVAANDAVRGFLKSGCDSAFFLDSDADIGPSYLEELRSLEDGWDYDIFQGFYTRRGWPPEAIWFKETELGDLMQCLVWKDNFTEETAMVGLHNTLIRREVFEAMLDAHPEIKPEDYHYFHYPRHAKSSEDGPFCVEARELGFRVGSTTKVKSGHITRITVGWDTYQEWLQLSGAADQWREYYDLVEMVADYTGESYDTVIAKSIRGWQNTKPAFEKAAPKTVDEYREFYGQQDNGYLYDLLSWNISPSYKRITEPLKQVEGKRVLVVGAGLGGEVEVLADKNSVDVFELPGVLRDFCAKRFKDNPHVLICGDARLDHIHSHDCYDLIVAIDVIEHFHPDEFESTLDAMLDLLAPDGSFYLHNNFREAESMPQAFNHAEWFNNWCIKRGVVQPDAPYGYYRRQNETIIA